MFDEMQKDIIEKAYVEILEAINENPTRAGLRQTPERIARWLEEATSGYYKPDFKIKQFEVNYSGMVVKSNIPFTSMCEHHMLPYSGKSHFGYIPKEIVDGSGKVWVIGISKISRIIQHYARRLSIQEGLTQVIFDKLKEATGSDDCMLVMTAIHECEACRGIMIDDSPLTTSALSGKFDHEPVRMEFLKLLERKV